MKRTFAVWFVSLATNLVPAQETAAPPDPLVAGRQRLAAALQKTSTLQDVAFTVAWGPDQKAKEGDTPPPWFAMVMNTIAGKATGSWHDSLLHVAYDNEQGDEILRAGARTVARDKHQEWCLRTGRFADGNSIPFEPDTTLLLQQLAAMDLAVVQRTVGSLDDRPVEILSVTLNPDQVAALAWTATLPNAVLADSTNFRFALMAAAGGNRTPAQAPDVTIDLAIAIDPGTSLVQNLHFRCWSKTDGNQRVVFAGGAVQVMGGAKPASADENDADDDEKTDDTKKADAPLSYQDGLPKRPRKRMQVMDYTVRLTEHGTRKAPELSPLVTKLLRR